MMAKYKRIMMLVVLAFIMSLAAACGTSSSSASNPVSQAAAKVVTQGMINKMHDYYGRGKELEKELTVLDRMYSQTQNTFRTGARDLIANNTSCYKSVAQTESAIAEAALGNMEGDALVNVLATGASVTGEQATSKCVDLNTRLAEYIVGHRKAVQDAHNNRFEKAQDYRLYLEHFPELEWMNDLLQTYGSPQGVYNFLESIGIPGVTDWTWLPTKGLWTSHSNKEKCDYYRNGKFKDELARDLQRQFKGHEDSLYNLYDATWNSSNSECRLYRFAALEWMERDVVSRDTRDVQESGEDTSVYITPQPE
jgi:hypothetical protein